MIQVSGFLLILLALLGLIAYLGFDASITLFVQAHKTEEILLGVLLLSVLLYGAFASLVRHMKVFVADRIEARRFLSRIKRLSPSDKHILSMFVDERKLVRELDLAEPSVAWLESIKLIQRGNGSSDGKRVPFRISLYAMDYLSRNPNLLR